MGFGCKKGCPKAGNTFYQFRNYKNTISLNIEIMGRFVSLKMIYKKMFSAFSSVYFVKNKWSTENIFLVNWKSSHFFVKCFTDLKNVKYFIEFFFFDKIFFRKSFFKKYFFENDFSWNKLNLYDWVFSDFFFFFQIRKIFYRKMILFSIY